MGTLQCLVVSCIDEVVEIVERSEVECSTIHSSFLMLCCLFFKRYTELSKEILLNSVNEMNFPKLAEWKNGRIGLLQCQEGGKGARFKL